MNKEIERIRETVNKKYEGHYLDEAWDAKQEEFYTALFNVIYGKQKIKTDPTESEFEPVIKRAL